VVEDLLSLLTVFGLLLEITPEKSQLTAYRSEYELLFACILNAIALFFEDELDASDERVNARRDKG
jgi:hypothetical protein